MGRLPLSYAAPVRAKITAKEGPRPHTGRTNQGRMDSGKINLIIFSLFRAESNKSFKWALTES